MAEQQSSAIKCPKCGVTMTPITAGDITVDRCEKCLGIWLDEGERLKLLKDRRLVAEVDTGDEAVGEQHDGIRQIDCPHCRVPLFHVTDRAQKHIGFEFCRQCHGSFLDAGELRDLSEFTISERLKALFGR